MEPLPMETNTMEKMLLSRAAASQRPLNGSLELLPLCNMNCDMCYIRLSRSEMEKKAGYAQRMNGSAWGGRCRKRESSSFF